MGYHFREADIEPLLLMIADQMHGSSRRNDDPARRTPAIVDLISNMAALARLSAEPAETRLQRWTAGARSDRSNGKAWRPTDRSAAA